MRRIPLWLKLIYTAFVAVLVPCYWLYWGPQNLLNFCDLALLIVLVGLWTESSLLISTQAIAILLPQVYWVIDFVMQLIRVPGPRMTAYMFDPHSALFLRGLSLFHGWMPVLIIWCIRRLGYDRRALGIQSACCSVLLLICYFAFVPPGTVGGGRPAVNLNFVFGASAYHAQTIMPPPQWLAMLMVGIPMVIYLPTHLLLRRWQLPKRWDSPLLLERSAVD